MIGTYLKGAGARFIQACFALLVVADVAAQVVLKFLPWVLFARARPSSRETISATLGWGAAHGYRWLAFLAGLVDDVFGKGHCHAAYLDEAADELPL